MCELFDKFGVEFVSATEEFNTTSSTGKLIRDIILVFAQWERELTRERVSDKIIERSKKGLWNGGNPPFGYDNDSKQKLLVPNEAEALWVKRVYKMARDGMTPTEIAKYLNDKDVKTKLFDAKKREGKPLKQRGGNLWLGKNISRMIEKRLYYGVIVHLEKVYEGQHKAIVSQEIWEDANNTKSSI